MYKMSKVKVGSFAVPQWDNLFRFFLILALLASLMIYAGGNVQSVGAASNNPMYVSFDGNVIFNGVTFSDDDIIRYTGTTWEMFFDGIDVGLGSGPDANAFELLSENVALFVFFDTVPILLNGGTLSVEANDVVQFTATNWGSATSGTFSLILDGPTVGLDTTAERIDSLHALPDGSLLISTTGNPTVPVNTAVPLGATITVNDEDILRFAPAAPSDYSSGTWSLYFDASAVGMAGADNDIDALDVVGNKVYLSTAGSFTAPGGLTGDNQDVFSCTISGPTNCTFDSELYFDSSAFPTQLLDRNLDSLVILDLGPIPPHLTSITRQTPATTPTNADTLVFRATFDENVMNVNAADFVVNGTTTATPTSVSAVSQSVYDVTVSGGNLATFNGVVGLNLSAGNDITDLDANALVFAEPAIDETYTVDNSAPMVSSIVRANPSPTSAATVNFTVTFSEVVTGVAASDFSLTTSGVTGAAIQTVTGSGTTYNVPVTTGSGSGTIRLDVPNSATVVDLLGNPLSGLPFVSGATYTVDETITASFGDVPTDYWAFSFVERLANAGVTSGCGGGNYCPESSVTRAEMAVFLLRGIHGSSYIPPAVGASTGFGDVATDYWAAAFVKQLAVEGITTGCGGGNYCPEAPVTRAEMAVFLLRGIHGSSYTPPAVGASTGFGDVATDYWAAAFVKQLAAEGITTGCGGGNYCPESPVTRAEMAVFLVRAFNLP